MTIREEFRCLPKPEISDGLLIDGVNVNFKGFKAGILPLDLETWQYYQLRSFLEFGGDDHPRNATVIFDGKKPILALVTGNRDNWSTIGPQGLIFTKEKYLYKTAYLQLIKTNPDNNNIFIEDAIDYHQFEDRNGWGLDLKAGNVTTLTIIKEKRNFVIQIKEANINTWAKKKI